MINALFLFNQRGDLLISKLLKNGVKGNIADIFRIQVITNQDLRSPLLTLGSTTFLYIKHHDLWLVAVTRSNTDSAVILEYLYSFKNILQSYLGGSIDEDSIKEHVSIVYDLIDETLEFGYPSNLELNHLKAIIPPIHTNNIKKSKLNIRANSNINVQQQSNGPSEVSWREKGLKYRRNEIFLDIYEKLNVLIAQDGKIIRSYVDGSIEMKTHLSGMPLCKFGLNDSLNVEQADLIAQYDVKNKKAIPKAAAGSVVLEDCKFHQCVELNKFDSERLIQFIPPDGEFKLMTYRSSENLNFPFKLTPTYTQLSSSKSELRVSLKSLFPQKVIANDVVVKIPLQNAIDVEFASSGGKSRFQTKDGAIYWKFNKFNGLTEHSLTAKVTYTPQDMNKPAVMSARPPMTLDFELLMFSSSGIVVRFLKVQEQANYNTIKWVRYISQGGSYEVRY